MKNIINYIKNVTSFFWKKPMDGNDTKLRLYEFLFFICIVFMVIYSMFFLINFKNSPTKFTHNYSSNNVTNIQSSINVSINDTNLPKDEFFIGEIVEIKDFGILGVVIQKTLYVDGYMYDVRWKNIERDLPKDSFYSWELRRPEKYYVPVSDLLTQ